MYIKILKSILAVLLSSLLLLLFAGYFLLQKYMDTPLQIKHDGMNYVLVRGSSFSVLAHSLAKQEVLSKPRWLILYGRLSGDAVDIKAGEYHFQQGMTPRQLLQKVKKGEVNDYDITLVEGWTLEQAYAELQQQGKLKKSLGVSWREKLATLLAVDKSVYPTLEGLFFPDTYRFHSEIKDEDILVQAYARLQKVLAQEWEKRIAGLPYKHAYEALIMASLIEKETGVASERAQIAGVFVRRLQKGMRLQTDPTVIYGLGAQFDGNLRTRHLKDKNNLYNTYKHGGLPPTPIALVGREAIHAALHPMDGDALYFVAKGDGTHYFSSTLEEHKSAVRKYQIVERKKNYSSTPVENALLIHE